MEKIADKLKLFRKRKGLSQEEFADKIGVTRATISNVRSNRPPSLSLVIKISEAFPEIDLNWLLKDYIPRDGEWVVKDKQSEYVTYLENTLESIKRIAQTTDKSNKNDK